MAIAKFTLVILTALLMACPLATGLGLEQASEGEPATLITKGFSLRYILPQDAVNAIKKIISSSGMVESFAVSRQEGAEAKATDIIVVQDTPQIIERASRLLETLDTPVLPAVKITLNYADADLGEVLSSLSDEAHMNIVVGPQVQGKVNVHLVDVSLENALNSILLSNGYTYIKEGDILRVIPLSEVKKEAPAPAAPLAIEIFTLQYVNANDIKNSLSKFLSPEGIMQVFSRTASGGLSATGESEGVSDTSITGIIPSSPASGSKTNKTRSNILIVRDRPKVIRNISRLIKELDIEPKQIWIEAKFITVTLTDADKLGIDWTVKATLTGSKVPSTLPFKNTRGSIDNKGNFIPKPIGTSTDFATGTLFPYAVKGDFVFGSISFADFKAVLEALKQNDKTNIISAPKVAVLDGESALINVGKNYPIPTYELNKDTGQLVVSGYQIEKIGIILRATPHAIGEGRVMLKLHPEVSEIESYVGPNDERPVTTAKEIDTTITVADGDTIVIGGLITDEKKTHDHRVPFLSNIPLLGRALFTYKSEAVDKTELLIFVTPRIAKKYNSEELNAQGLARKAKK